ncbi:MAG: hypothetical protein MUC50_18410, partial [Myxococcota bacterium]|nr:hypothetical protein [Myxococcota bacterium]
MTVLAKRYCATMLGLVLVGLAFGSCQGNSTSQPPGLSQLAMFIDDCVDEYLTCRDECIPVAEPSGFTGTPQLRTGGIDGQPGYPGAGGGAGSLPGAEMHCFYPIDISGGPPAATAEYVLETFKGLQTVHVRLTFNPAFVDNSYGATAIGWGDKGHQFKQLVGSDHAEIRLYDTAGVEKVSFKEDYISETNTTPSGYGTLGVTGGDGDMLVGVASVVVGAKTSLGLNMNDRGYAQYTVDSPATNAAYAPNPAAPLWDYRVVYEVWVLNNAFGTAGFGSAKMTYVHASPSKASDNTWEVVEGDCPDDWKDTDTDTGTGTGNDTDTGTTDTSTGTTDTSTGTTDTSTGTTDTSTGSTDDTDSETDSNSDGIDDGVGECIEGCDVLFPLCMDKLKCIEGSAADTCMDWFGVCMDNCK